MRDVSKPPRRFHDASIAVFRLATWLTSAVWPGRRAYRWYLAHGGLEGCRRDVPLPGLPPALDGLRVVHLSDFHGGLFLDASALGPVVDLVRGYAPHLVAITGDFITRGPRDVHLLGSIFAQMPAPLGRFAVFGNHDYRFRREGEIAAVLRRQGVRVLRNESVLVEHSGARVRVAGLEDIEEGRRADLDAALADAEPGDDLTLLLCHHPDVGDLLPPGTADLVLSGHTHGGQVVLPGLGPLARRWLPERLAGLFPLAGGGWLHVSRGVGVLVVPFRVGARAEVACLTLRRPEPGD